MATLGSLKQHVRDYTADMASGKATRVSLDLVNDALRELFRSHRWSRYLKRTAEIQLEQAAAGVAAALTQGSDEVVLTGENVLNTYRDDQWDLKLEGDDVTLYRAVEIMSPTRFRLDRPWIAATDAAASYTWKRSRYPLPDGFVKLLNAHLSVSRSIGYMEPDRFDRERFERVTETGVPQVFTVREGRVEVWPPLATTTTREALLLTFDSTPVMFTENDPDSKAADWPEVDDDLLRAAIDMQIVARHSRQTHLDPRSTQQRYMRLLGAAKSRDAGRVRDDRPFGLAFHPDLGEHEHYLFKRAPQGADD